MLTLNYLKTELITSIFRRTAGSFASSKLEMIIKKIKSTNISGFKLVVATVSTGNVAQLAADLFIESLNMDKYAMVS